MPALLEVKGLSKSFAGLRAAQDLTFTVGEGEIVALIGPNGAGKTTCFNMIAGMHRPDAGLVLLDGQRLDGRRPDQVCRAGVGRTFQLVKPFAGLSVLDNVVVGALKASRSVSEARMRADEVLDLLGLGGKRGHPAASLTLPERKRLEVARALATGIRALTGRHVGVILSDTLGRPWREGQTDIAIGAAGVHVFDDLRGSADASGKPLAVTMPCVADQLAGAAELVKGKSSGVPVAVVRGLGRYVGDLDLPGARSILRPAERDLFRVGADEAYNEGYRDGFDESQAEGVADSAS